MTESARPCLDPRRRRAIPKELQPQLLATFTRMASASPVAAFLEQGGSNTMLMLALSAVALVLGCLFLFRWGSLVDLSRGGQL